MSKIILATNSGFCFGVRQAMEKTLNELENKETEEGRIYTYGPIIHNNVVIEELKTKGVDIIRDLEGVSTKDTVIVRSHGESKSFFEESEEAGIKVIDATCPFVKKIQDIVHRAKEEEKPILIIGDKKHPEVMGINGWCDNSAVIVNSTEEAENISGEEFLIVCQTTIKKELAEEILKVLNSKNIKYIFKNTICNATALRQEEVRKLAKNCDCMLIIGGKESSNTKKLYEIAQKNCKNTYFIEKKEDLLLHQLEKYNTIGIATGASTPESVIKEVIATMSENITEMRMEDFMDEIEQSLKLPKLNEIVKGTVHQVTDKEVVVNMGCKKDGVIPKEEVVLEKDQSLSDLFKVGDEVRAKVIKTDDGEGVITLSAKKLEVIAHWKEIQDAFESKSVLSVNVLRAVNGGVLAAYKEVVGFIPISQLADRHIDTVDEFIGKTLPVKVSRVDQKRGKAVFSRRVILKEEKRAKAEALWASLNVGDVVEGKVMRFTDYGAFVDLGGIDGLLHISEISWGKLKHPSELLKLEEVIKVQILAKDDETGKISLGLKQTTPEPWSVIHDKYAVGDIISGKVAQITDFGAFVEIEPGLDGLVHISEIANRRIEKVSDEISIGDIISAEVLDIDQERRRISLSIKRTLPVAEEAAVEEEPVVEEVGAVEEEPVIEEAPLVDEAPETEAEEVVKEETVEDKE